jgi:hypothetical protein
LPGSSAAAMTLNKPVAPTAAAATHLVAVETMCRPWSRASDRVATHLPSSTAVKLGRKRWLAERKNPPTGGLGPYR